MTGCDWVGLGRGGRACRGVAASCRHPGGGDGGAVIAVEGIRWARLVFGLIRDFGFGKPGPGGAVFASAQGFDGAGQIAEGPDFMAERRSDFAIPSQKQPGVTGGKHGGQMMGEAALSGLFELAGAGSQILGVRQEIALGLPFAETPGAPFAEVLLGERFTRELLPQHSLNSGEGVEPGEEASAGFGVLEAVVEFFPNIVGQAGDFSVANHRMSGRGLGI